MRFQMRADVDASRTNENVITVKPEDREVHVELPKLVITKFDGTHLDWLRFWSQFQQVDNSRLPISSKFSLLKEYLNPKVRLIIDGLPLNADGYIRAKEILKSKYGRQSEVANAHIQGIIALPTIHHTAVHKIHEFYEKLARNVQSLDTMDRLD